MSLKPGLGAVAAERIAAFLGTKEGSAVLAGNGGRVPSVVRQAQKKWAIGRYLRGRVAAASGIDEDAVSRLRQLNDQLVSQQLGQVELNDLVEVLENRAYQSGLKAERKFQRQSLEKKL